MEPSEIGFIVSELIAPMAYTDSLIGYYQTELVEPQQYGDSRVGFATVELVDPPKPTMGIRVWTNQGFVPAYVLTMTEDGLI